MTPFTGVPLSKAAQFVGIQQDYTQSEDRTGALPLLQGRRIMHDTPHDDLKAMLDALPRVGD
ncbi:MAG: hypothetical protein ACLPKW_35655 [Acetobacteraceae bacterium]